MVKLLRLIVSMLLSNVSQSKATELQQPTTMEMLKFAVYLGKKCHFRTFPLEIIFSLEVLYSFNIGEKIVCLHLTKNGSQILVGLESGQLKIFGPVPGATNI